MKIDYMIVYPVETTGKFMMSWIEMAPSPDKQLFTWIPWTTNLFVDDPLRSNQCGIVEVTQNNNQEINFFYINAWTLPPESIYQRYEDFFTVEPLESLEYFMADLIANIITPPLVGIDDD